MIRICTTYKSNAWKYWDVYMRVTSNIEFKETRCHVIELAEILVQWRAIFNTKMNFDYYVLRNFLTSCTVLYCEMSWKSYRRPLAWISRKFNNIQIVMYFVEPVNRRTLYYIE
jgi:hypothetical protein